MSSELLKDIAAGKAFDLVASVREIARVLTEGPIEVEGMVIAGGGIHGLAGGAGKSAADVPATLTGGTGEAAASGKKK